MTLHIVQMDRETCEVPGHKDCPGEDWDHCIFPKNKRFSKFVNNHFNMLRACAISNRHTKETDRFETKQWLIDYHLDGNYRKEFLEWIEHPPRKFRGDMFRIYNYIATRLDKEQQSGCE